MRLFVVCLVLIVCSVLLLGLPPNAANAADDVVVQNRGTHTLAQIYVTATAAHLLFGDRAWQSNILGNHLPPGARTTFSKGPQRATTACDTDMKFVYTDGYVRIGKQINLCRVHNVMLRY